MVGGNLISFSRAESEKNNFMIALKIADNDNFMSAFMFNFMILDFIVVAAGGKVFVKCDEVIIK